MSYTLAQYITNTAGSWVTNLPLVTADLDFIAFRVLQVYGVSTEAEATDLSKLYALADVELFSKIVKELAQDYAFSADGTSHSRNQVFEQAKQLLTDALSKADGMNAFGNCTINTSKIVYDTDPYDYGYAKGLYYPAIYWRLV